MIDSSRRSLIIGIGASLIAAPAIVRASSLMRVRVLKPPFETAFPLLVSHSSKDWEPVLNVDGRYILQNGFIMMERRLTADSTGSVFPAGTVAWL